MPIFCGEEGIPNTTRRLERPSIIAIVANRSLDAVVVSIGTLVIAWPFYMLAPTMGKLFVFLGLLGALLIIIRMLFDFLEREYALYSLDADRLTVDHGIINRQRIVIPLDVAHIQRVAANQPFLGRVVGYGNVVVFTIGWGTVRLKYVSDPYAWQEDILQHLACNTSAASSSSQRVSTIKKPTSKPSDTTKSYPLIMTGTGLIVILCVCSLLLSVGNTALGRPIPTPTPATSMFVLPNITGSDILASMWSLYQIPTIFWSVNIVILANIALFIMQAIGNRKR